MATASRMNLSALLNPIPIAIGLLVILFIAASLIQGGFGTRKDETRFGLASLCRLRWNDFARIVGIALKEQRGMTISGMDRTPGKGGFDLLFQRGATTYLVQCKNNAAQKVTAQMVGELNSLMESNDAAGAIIASCGAADSKALALAQERRIELIAGQDLWLFLRQYVPHDVLEGAQLHAAKRRIVRLLISGGIALVASLMCLVYWPSQPQAAFLPTTSPVSRPGATATPQPAAPVGVVDETLTEEQLEARRAEAEQEVRTLPQVMNAGWQTQSTLLVRYDRDASTEAESVDRLAEEACALLLKREELRYTRLQLEFPPENPGDMPQTRWRQCR